MSASILPGPSSPPSRPQVVTFLSDFGRDDTFVGVCHGVMLRTAPAVRIIDLTHEVPPQDVATGAYRLSDCVEHLPGAVHLAVVDPGVGGHRAALAIAAGPVDDPTWLVGPDNGLLLPAAERLGGVRSAWRLTVHEGASATFHGRDVFAPAAARLAAGAVPTTFAKPVTRELVRLPDPPPTRVDADAARVASGVRDIDRFGNVQLFAGAGALGALGVPGTRVMIQRGPGASPHARTAAGLVAGTFGELPGAVPGVLADSVGRIAVVINGGSAAATLGLARGDAVTLVAGPSPRPVTRSTPGDA